MNRTLRNARHGATRCALALGALLLSGAPAAFASHSVFVTVPGHSEEALTWCGAAVGQMVMGGYPAAACTHDQADVDASIQAHKAEANWDTDPVGLRDAMMALCPPPGGHWTVHQEAAASTLMYSVARWMTRNHYPVAALLDTQSHNSYLPHAEHWVAIKGIVTDVDPTSPGVTSVNLEYVFIVDPAVDLGDPPDERFMEAGVWYGELQAVTKAPSAYTGQFVALIEPPQRPGRALARERVLVGRVIPAERALRLAHEHVRKLALPEMEAFRGFARARPLKPLLVNPERGGYYLVPFGEPGRPVTLAVIVNAYTGAFEEAGRFAPRTFLPEKEAVERARGVLARERPVRPNEIKAVLVASPEAGTRYAPAWRVSTRERTLAVDPRGEVRELQRR